MKISKGRLIALIIGIFFIGYIVGMIYYKQKYSASKEVVRNIIETTTDTSLRLKNEYYEYKKIEIDGTYTKKVDRVIKEQIMETFDKTMFK